MVVVMVVVMVMQGRRYGHAPTRDDCVTTGRFFHNVTAPSLVIKVPAHSDGVQVRRMGGKGRCSEVC
ncbi:hypothetical protein E2C01_019618 [Portunus trituberculatus]|uniref:Uncharacterized protein n=1 Tax=Portunus trituberculatus TaxID=210409 RepID=A0A5B7DYF2_PORTR|nr:hypothetical protein [Portunus trituberculatus]